MKKILFVCSGNTCRSPLAEVIARQVLADERVAVSSAGSSAMEGSPASQFSIDVAGLYGMDLSGHRARLLDAAMVRDADLIVTMGARHREVVGTLDPNALEYTFLLTNFSDRHHGEIPDPIGAPLPVYQTTFGVIRECIEAMAAHLPRFDGWKPAARGKQDRT